MRRMLTNIGKKLSKKYTTNSIFDIKEKEKSGYGIDIFLDNNFNINKLDSKFVSSFIGINGRCILDKIIYLSSINNKQIGINKNFLIKLIIAEKEIEKICYKNLILNLIFIYLGYMPKTKVVPYLVTKKQLEKEINNLIKQNLLIVNKNSYIYLKI